MNKTHWVSLGIIIASIFIIGITTSFAYFVLTSVPWFRRGGVYNDGSEAGMFAFLSEYGRMASWIGFRLVLTP